MTVQLTEPENLPALEISINVPGSPGDYHDVDCPIGWKVPDGRCTGSACETGKEITIEGSLDGDVVVVVAFPHDGNKVDRPTVHQTLALMSQSIDQILDTMEAAQ